MVRAVYPYIAVAAMLFVQTQLHAAILYSQNFDGVGSLGFGFGTLNISAMGSVGDGGVSGSKAYSVPFNGTNAPSSIYSIAFGKMNAVPASDAAPLGAGLIYSSSQIRFSLDIKVKGNLVPNPVSIAVRQRDSGYEQAHGVDANGDGDMTDSAMNFESVFKPILVDGADFVRVQFTLNQGALRSSIVRSDPCCSNIPLVPIFDPTVSLDWSISFGSGAVVGNAGFGLDAGNIVTVDNILIEAVPEPPALVMACFCAVVATSFRYRREKRGQERKGDITDYWISDVPFSSTPGATGSASADFQITSRAPPARQSRPQLALPFKPSATSKRETDRKLLPRKTLAKPVAPSQFSHLRQSAFICGQLPWIPRSPFPTLPQSGQK